MGLANGSARVNRVARSVVAIHVVKCHRDVHYLAPTSLTDVNAFCVVYCQLPVHLNRVRIAGYARPSYPNIHESASRCGFSGGTLIFARISCRYIRRGRTSPRHAKESYLNMHHPASRFAVQWRFAYRRACVGRGLHREAEALSRE